MITPSRVLRLAAAALVLAAMAACTREVDVGELRAAIGDSPVVMLSTTTCGYCRQLRADLGDWGVDFEDLDVESDQNGWDAYEQVNGRGVDARGNTLAAASPEKTRHAGLDPASSGL